MDKFVKFNLYAMLMAIFMVLFLAITQNFWVWLIGSAAYGDMAAFYAVTIFLVLVGSPIAIILYGLGQLITLLTLKVKKMIEE